MAAEEPRAKRTTKKPAWLLDNIDPTSTEAEGYVKAQRQQHRRSSHNESSTHRAGTATKPEAAEHQHRPDLPHRMCLNPSCKSPFDSPQWRRGPLGPGTLCNACGTRYARIEAKKRGEKRGGSKLRPQDIAEWQVFEQQLQRPLDVRQAWQQAHAHHSSRFPCQQSQQQQSQQQQYSHYDMQQQQYDDEYEAEAAQGYASYTGDDCPQHVSGQQHAACFDDDELLCQEGMPDDDSPGRELAAAAADGVGVGPTGAAAGSLPWAGLHGLPLHVRSKQQQQLDSGQWLLDPALQLGGSCRDSPCQDEPALLAGSRPGNRRRQRRYDEDASDSQEAAACSYQELQNGCISSGKQPESRGGGGGGQLQAADPCDQFLHLLAVGEAMINTEGVPPQERREAWAEYVEKQLPAEQHKPATHVADNAVGVKRSRFGAEAEEQQVSRPDPASVPAQSKDRFERLLAEAEQCIRARSASPLLRPITPQSDVIASSRVVHSEAAAGIGAGTTGPRGTVAGVTGAGAGASMAAGGCGTADQSPVPRSRLGDAGRQSRQASLPPFMLPAAATSTSNINVVAAGARPTADAGGV